MSESAESVESHSGYLTKEGGVFKTWNKRWFELERKGKKLRYYTKKGGKNKGVIDLRGAKVENAKDRESKSKRKNLFKIVTPDRIWYLQAESQDDKESWINVIFDIISPPKEKRSTVKATASNASSESKEKEKNNDENSEEHQKEISSEKPNSSSDTKTDAEPEKNENENEEEKTKEEQKEKTIETKTEGNSGVAVAVSNNLYDDTDSEDSEESGEYQPKSGDISADEEESSLSENDFNSKNENNNNNNNENNNDNNNTTTTSTTLSASSISDALHQLRHLSSNKDEDSSQVKQPIDNLLNDMRTIIIDQDRSADGKDRWMRSFIDEDGCSALLSIIRQFDAKSNDIHIHRKCFTILADVLDYDPTQRTVLLILGGAATIISTLIALHRHAPTSDSIDTIDTGSHVEVVVAAGIRILARLFEKPSDDMQNLLDNDTQFESLLETVEEHIGNIDLAEAFLRLANSICFNFDNLEMFLEHNGARSVAAAYAFHAEDPKRILPRVLEFSERSAKFRVAEDVAEAFVTEDAVAAVFLATIAGNAKDEHTVSMGMKLVKNLCVTNSVAEGVVTVMTEKIEDRDVVSHALTVIHNLRTDEFREILSSSETIKGMTELMQHYIQDTFVIKYTLEILIFLLSRNLSNQSSFVKYGGTSLLIRITEQYSKSFELCSLCVQLLSVVCENDSHLKDLTRSKSGVRCVFDVVQNNDSVAKILNPALKMLVDMIIVVEDLQETIYKELITCMLCMIKEKRDDSFVCEKCFIILYIISEKYEVFELHKDEARAMLDSVKNHSSDEDFVAVFFQLSGALGSLNRNRDTLVKQHVVEYLKELKKQFSESKKIQKASEGVKKTLGVE